METITSPPTLPASWQPTASSCVSSSDYWAWDYGSDSDRWVVLGGPSQTTDCLPTSWESDVVFSGVQCPRKYTSACQGTDSRSEVTCCPNLYKFSCVYPVSSENHGHLFRCESAWPAVTTFNVTSTQFDGSPPATKITTRNATNHLFALAVVYVTSTFTDNPADATQTREPSDSTKSTSGSGLSAGASAGIGIGAAAGTVLLAFVVWYIYRGRRSARQAPDMRADHSMQPHETGEQGTSTESKTIPPIRSELPENLPAARELPAYPS